MKTSVCRIFSSFTWHVVLLLFVSSFCCPGSAWADMFQLKTKKHFQLNGPKTNLFANPIISEIYVEPYDFWFTLVQGESADGLLYLVYIGEGEAYFEISILDETRNVPENLESDWLSVFPESGILWPEVTEEVYVIVETSGLEPGIYQKYLLITGSGPFWIPDVEVSVYLEVLPPILPPAPQNLQAELIGNNDVKLTWEPPAGKELQFYNIYDNNISVGTIPFLFYYLSNLSPGVHSFTVTAVYDEGESGHAGPVEVTIYGSPEIVLSQDSLYQQLYPAQAAAKSFYIYNTGDADLTYTLNIDTGSSAFDVQPENNPVNIRKPKSQKEPLKREKFAKVEKVNDVIPGFSPEKGQGKQTDDLWDIYYEHPCAVGGGEAGAETDGYYLYTTKWNGPQFYKYDYDGNFIEEFTIDGVSDVRDLAYDGTYFYGGAASTTVFKMDFDNQTLISTINAAVATRAIAYDGSEDGFWANNWSDTPTLFDRAGAVLNSFNIGGDESFYGFAYMDNHLGENLIGFGQSGSGIRLIWYDLPSGSYIEDMDLMTILNLPVTGDIAGGLFYCENDQSGMMFLGGLVQNVCLWGLEIMQYPRPYDCGVRSIISPVSGPNLTNNETITVKVKNFGWWDLTDIPIFAVFEGDTIAHDTVQETLVPGESIEFTFNETIDLSGPGVAYTLESCTALDIDEVPDNDCKSETINNTFGTYCTASTSTEDEYIANVLCGDINNTSGWQGGVADYTDLSTEILTGVPLPIFVTNGNAWAPDIVHVWVDWNNNFEFEGGSEEFHLINIGGTGEAFEGVIEAPVGASPGNHRMRIRMNYSAPPQPCGNAAYGEIEDYTLNVVAYNPYWLEIVSPGPGTVAPGDSAQIDVLFNAQYANYGLNETFIEISNNSPVDPVFLPVGLNVVDEFPPPLNFQAVVVDTVNVLLNWDAPQIAFPIGYNIYRDDEIISTVVDTSFLDIGLITGTYEYKITAWYPGGESQSTDPVFVAIADLSQIVVAPEVLGEFHFDPPQITAGEIIIKNEGGTPLFVWIELQTNNQADNSLVDDIGVVEIIAPSVWTNVFNDLDIVVVFKNFGTAPQANFPYQFSWSGPYNGNHYGIFNDTLFGGEEIIDTLPWKADFSANGLYHYDVCTLLENDQDTDNNCSSGFASNPRYYFEPYCDYTSGCYLGDGLIYWDLANITVPEIPCEGAMPYYHNYTNMIHYLPSGDYQLTVQDGYGNQYFDVWIDYNDDFSFSNEDELVIDDAYCYSQNTYYTFPLNIPSDVTPGLHYMRVRTNYGQFVSCPTCTYTYGNCCDFKVFIPDVGQNGWLSVNPLSGIISPGDSMQFFVAYNSYDLLPGDYLGSVLVHSNDPVNPIITVPVTLFVGDCPLPPPQNLVGSIINDNEVLLQWEPPQLDTVIRWGDGINADGIGLAGVSDWYVSARWDGSNLAPFTGMYLTAVEFFPTSTMGAEYTIKVWKGENADTLMAEQPVLTYIPNQWNTVALDNPVQIDSTQDLWIGYQIIESQVGDFPAGIDAGPAVPFYGDLISMDAVNWDSMSIGFGLDYNWNIAGVLSANIGGKPLAQPLYLSKMPIHPTEGIHVLKGGLPPPFNREYKNSKAGLLGYNVYRDAQQINSSTIPDTFYTEQLPPSGTYEYYVTAVYDECESEPSNTVTIVAPPPMPEIQVGPDEFVFELEMGLIIDDVMNITNIGFDTLEYSIAISYETGLMDDDWLNISPLTGSLPEGQNQAHSIQVNTNGLNPGGYNAAISIASNDPDNPVVEVPVELTVLQPPLAPPQNLRAEVVNINKIELNWDPPAGKAFLYYNIYRGGELIGNTVNTTYYSDEYGPGIYTFMVSAVYSEGESGPAGPVEAIVGCPLPAPQYFDGIEITPDIWQFIWGPPEGPDRLRWDNGENAPGVPMPGGGAFSYAARWEPAQLQPYVGYFLSHVEFFPKENPSAEFVLKVWKGVSAANLILEQPISNFSPEEWNTIKLYRSIEIDASEELWIGFEVSYSTGGSPAGHDYGPAAAGNGDLISLDGTNWDSMSIAYGFDFNWNIAGILFQFPDRDFSSKEAFGGYNFYRDSIKINTNLITETTYTDSVPAWGHLYHVSAVYDGCEAFADPWTLWIGISENTLDEVILFPNPATDEVFIQSKQPVQQIRLLSLLGKVVLDNDVDGKKTRIDVSGLKPGVYVVEVETQDALITRKLVVE